MKKVILYFAATVVVFASFGAETQPDFWETALELAPGIKYKTYEVASPRLMKCYLARVDLTKNDLVSTECGRRRERTLEFAERLCAGGTNVVLAVNACPWSGGCGDGASITNFTLDGVNVQNGRVSSDKPIQGWFDGFFVLRQDGTPEILDAPPTRPLGDYRIVLNGYACVLKDGQPFNRRKDVDLHPRTVIGVSKDRRYVYLLAIDGRQTGWSLGADYADEARLMLEAGAWEAANMDGGGSTTVVCRSPETGRLAMQNRHDVLRRYSRAIAINLAVVPKSGK